MRRSMPSVRSSMVTATRGTACVEQKQVEAEGTYSELRTCISKPVDIDSLARTVSNSVTFLSKWGNFKPNWFPSLVFSTNDNVFLGGWRTESWQLCVSTSQT